MFNHTVLCLPRSDAIRHAAAYLRGLGISVTEKCEPDVTHLLLPVPSFSGGDEYLAHVLAKLPEDLIISGGNLISPLLEGYACVDFLRDERYLAENAAITADCALMILENATDSDLSGRSALILGWGRIGKCLQRLLQEKGVEVTVAARKPGDLAVARTLGGRSIPITDAAEETHRFDLIINTVPQLIIPDIRAKEEAILLELASRPGMTGGNIIDGRGLPGRLAPIRSGELIAKTFVRLSI